LEARESADVRYVCRGASPGTWVGEQIEGFQGPQRAGLVVNPLSYVTDEEKAYKLTQHFSAGSRVPGSKPDAYFDPKAEDILSGSRTSEGYCLGIMAIFLTKNGGIKPGTVHVGSL
jgi:hypothetical protein